MPDLAKGPNLLGFYLGVDGTGEWNREFSKAKKSMGDFDDQIGKTEKNVNVLGGLIKEVAKYAAPVAVFAAGKKAIDSAIASEETLSKIAVRLGPRSRFIEQYGDSFDALGREVGLSDEIIGEAYQTLIDRGYDAEQSMSLLTTSAKNAVGSFQPLGKMISAAMDVATAFDVVINSEEDLARIQNQLWKGVRNGAGDMGMLGSAVAKIGPALNAFGVDMPEIVAIAAQAGRAGKQGSEALEPLRSSLAMLVNPSKEAREFARSLGVELSDTAVRTQGFSRWLDHLSTSLDKAERSTGMGRGSLLRRMGFDASSVGLISLLTKNMGFFNTVVRQVNDDSNELFASYTEVSGQSQQQIKRMSVALDDIWSSAGQGLLVGMAGAEGLDRAVDKIGGSLGMANNVGETLGKSLRDLVEWGTSENGIPNLAKSVTLLADSLAVAIKPIKWLVDLGDWVEKTQNRANSARFKGEMARDVLQDARMRDAGFRAVPKQRNGKTVWVWEGNDSAGFGGNVRRQMSVGGWPEKAPTDSISSDSPQQSFMNDIFGNFAGEWQNQSNPEMAPAHQRTLMDWIGENTRGLLNKQSEDSKKQPKLDLTAKLELLMKKDGSTKLGKSSAQIAGAGSAEVNVAYRFFVRREGSGIDAVRPLPQNVVFAHIRPGD